MGHTEGTAIVDCSAHVEGLVGCNIDGGSAVDGDITNRTIIADGYGP